MIAEYAAAYGGPPAPDSAWRLFVALSARAPRFEARRQLTLYDSVSEAIGAQFGAKGAELRRSRLVERAYPLKQRAAQWLNMFRPDDVEPANG